MKKKFIYRRRTPMSIMEMANNCIGFKRPKKRGKHIKHAIMTLAYSSSIERAMKVTGLSKRRLKIVKATYLPPLIVGNLTPVQQYLKPRMAGKRFVWDEGKRGLNPDFIVRDDFKGIESRIQAQLVKRMDDHIMNAMGLASVQLGNTCTGSYQLMQAMQQDVNRKLREHLGMRVLKSRPETNNNCELRSNYDIIRPKYPNPIIGFNVC
jgi:hypothetical protein